MKDQNLKHGTKINTKLNSNRTYNVLVVSSMANL